MRIRCKSNFFTSCRCYGVLEHGESDGDLVDKCELVPEEEQANRTIPVPRVERNGNKEWSRNRNLRDELGFHQPTGSRVDIEEDLEAVIFFQFYFTDRVESYRGPGHLLIISAEELKIM